VDRETQVERIIETDQETQVDRIIEKDQETQVERVIAVDSETQVDSIVSVDNETQDDRQTQGEGVVVPSQDGGTSQSESTPCFNADDTLPGEGGDGDSVYDTSVCNYTNIMTPVKGQDRSPPSKAVVTLRDGTAQTDPVTIIIGDASFLVKKLKSSAVNPSKVRNN